MQVLGEGVQLWLRATENRTRELSRALESVNDTRVVLRLGDEFTFAAIALFREFYAGLLAKALKRHPGQAMIEKRLSELRDSQQVLPAVISTATPTTSNPTNPSADEASNEVADGSSSSSTNSALHTTGENGDGKDLQYPPAKSINNVDEAVVVDSTNGVVLKRGKHGDPIFGKPSSGLSLVYAMKDICKSVTVYGFGSHDVRGAPVEYKYYTADENVTMAGNVVSGNAGSWAHSFMLEQELLYALSRDEVIKFCTYDPEKVNLDKHCIHKKAKQQHSHLRKQSGVDHAKGHLANEELLQHRTSNLNNFSSTSKPD